MSSQKNCKIFKECGGAQVLYIILEYPSTRQYATGNCMNNSRQQFIVFIMSPGVSVYRGNKAWGHSLPHWYLVVCAKQVLSFMGQSIIILCY